MNSFDVVTHIAVSVNADFESFLYKRTRKVLFIKYAVNDFEIVKNVAVGVYTLTLKDLYTLKFP